MTRHSLSRSFHVAALGILDTIRTERNAQIQLGMALVATVAGMLLGLTALEWCLLVLASALVLSLELVNTALERAVDLAEPQIHPLAKQAKDAAAGAVLLAALASVVVGCIIFTQAALRVAGA